MSDLVEVTLICGRGLPAADANGFSDPYVKIFFGQKKAQSKVVQKTLNPMWQQTFYMPMCSSPFTVEVWDQDEGESSDDFLGLVTVDPSAFRGKGKVQSWFPLKARPNPTPDDAKPSGEIGLRFVHEGSPVDAGATGGLAPPAVPGFKLKTPRGGAKGTAAALKSPRLQAMDELALKKARARWAKLRTALMAKNLFCTKVSAKDVYGEARVATKASSLAASDSPGAQKIQAIIAQCKASGKKWTDPDFPPEASSLWRDANKPGGGPTCTGWKRVSEMHPKPKLFLDGVEAGDVMQGALGDCWFLGPLSVIAVRDKLLFNLFLSTEENEWGVYGCRFFQDGRWVDVVVDDHVPVTYGDAILNAKGPSTEEIWVPLIEKAYAKLHKSYEALISGTESTAFLDMTGQPPQETKLDGMSADDVFAKIIEASDAGHLLGCSCAKGGIEENRRGILMNHAYGILGYAKSEGHKLVKLRNPWGKGEWEGDWSDKSSKWTSSMKKALEFVDADDGIFWMNSKDFIAMFDRLFVCRMVPENWTKVREMNLWSRKGGSAGGCTNYPFWRYNPQYILEVPKPANISFLLTQPSQRHKGNNCYPQIGLYIAQSNCGNLKKLDMPKKDVVHGHEFLGAREYTVDLQLDPGTYSVMPCTYNPGVESSFTVSAFSEAAVKFNRAKNWVKVSATGAWKGKTAGGCSNHPSWANNPQFHLACKEAGKVVINLAPHNTKSKPHIGFQVFKDQNNQRISSAFGQLHTANFIDSDVSGEMELQPGKYVIVPSAFDPGVESEFIITCYGSGPILVGPLNSLDLSTFPSANQQGSNTPVLQHGRAVGAKTAASGGAGSGSAELEKWQKETVAAIDAISASVKSLRGKLNAASEAKQVVPVAKLLNDLRPKFELLRQLIPEQPRAKDKPKEADKVKTLKNMVITVLTDFFYVLVGCRKFLAESTDAPKISQIWQILKPLAADFARIEKSVK